MPTLPYNILLGEPPMKNPFVSLVYVLGTVAACALFLGRWRFCRFGKRIADGLKNSPRGKHQHCRNPFSHGPRRTTYLVLSLLGPWFGKTARGGGKRRAAGALTAFSVFIPLNSSFILSFPSRKKSISSLTLSSPPS